MAFVRCELHVEAEFGEMGFDQAAQLLAVLQRGNVCEGG
jgi:hypothetical protein